LIHAYEGETIFREMKFYVGVTDQEWFDYLRSRPGLIEVNFWQPSGRDEFRSLHKGDLFLFKLHRSARTQHRDVIAGGGVFVSFSVLPISLAWEAFERGNGAASYSEMRRRVLRHRKTVEASHEDFHIGCIILTQPFFLDDALWFSAPEWNKNIVRGKAHGYELEKAAGKFIWNNLQRVWEWNHFIDLEREARRIEEEKQRYGKESVIRPRLGQGAFRVLVTDAYHRSCAISGEHSLPALEAAHIKPYIDDGPHSVNNGLLLRSDIHRLFDAFYITVTPEFRIEVSRRLKEEFENGRSYYPFHGKSLTQLPTNREDMPFLEFLEWHNNNFGS
jgi:putative restriction endonuclease